MDLGSAMEQIICGDTDQTLKFSFLVKQVEQARVGRTAFISKFDQLRCCDTKRRDHQGDHSKSSAVSAVVGLSTREAGNHEVGLHKFPVESGPGIHFVLHRIWSTLRTVSRPH